MYPSSCTRKALKSSSRADHYPSSSANCLGPAHNVHDVTGGYYYDICKGDYGRLRQGIQYGYAERQSWSGTASQIESNFGMKGIDNMVWTSLRYYLP
jgi:hypothetical protein